MSRQTALDAICLRNPPRPAHTEYSLSYHKDYVRRATGMDPAAPGAVRALYERWAIDFCWSTNDGLHADWGRRGRATDMGHAVYAADGSDRRDNQPCPFATPEEVWAFDPAAEYGLPDFGEQVRAYEDRARKAREDLPDQLVTGGYYKTIVSGAIAAFGWDMFLTAAADPERIERVLDRFFRFTLHHMRAWAETSIEVVIQHDDFVWTEGPFMHPDFYRRAIIPRYAELWKPLRAAGKKVLFCSDGNFMMFARDVIEAGADGLIFEPCNDFDRVAEAFGATHCLVGSHVDCRDLTLRGWDAVRESMDRTLALLDRCPGLIWAVGNHLPANIPPDMMDRYIDYLKANWNRR